MIKLSPMSCCGCGVCEAVCGHGAIKMHPDALGFLYPEINHELCVGCGLCEKVCPFINVCSLKSDNQSVYAARHKDVMEVETSRSGAVFAGICDVILKEGGVVYGACFNDYFDVVHLRADNKLRCNGFKGSKYTQSNLTGIWGKVKSDLQAGKSVLFSGTPCQTSALHNYIPSHLKNKLYVLDIVCHGVAAPKVWKDYIANIESKEKRKLISVNFRDKQIYGWSGLHRESFTFDNGKVLTYPVTFYQPFLIRESCSHCPYASTDRPSDITIGDLWGWQNIDPSINKDDKGASLVLCNTPKGDDLFAKVKVYLDIVPTDMEKCLQPNLQYPSAEDSRRSAFEKDYGAYGFSYCFKKYYPVSFANLVKYRIKRILEKH